jgi:hypothetical protein
MLNTGLYSTSLYYVSALLVVQFCEFSPLTVPFHCARERLSWKMTKAVLVIEFSPCPARIVCPRARER